MLKHLLAIVDSFGYRALLALSELMSCKEYFVCLNGRRYETVRMCTFFAFVIIAL